VPLHFIANDLVDRLICCFPVLALDIFEGHIDNGVFPLIAAIVSSALPNLFILEIDGSIFIRFLEENTQHIHIQGLSETPRAREQGYQRTFIEEVLDHHRFINVVVT